ncbi:hypothetical protein VUJ46_22865 [Chryseobacterium sp. MYb264]|uniref:hypothetical protein n=1 Tax=Chryseobacterium sp. MYb264 TaxID=2745153 RepID=UPI002E0EC4B2|nr:hypothetical protein VUJ46_22865 [Chryseobacterium sp. MYb264]
MCDFTKGIKLCICNGDKIKYRQQDTYKKVKGELIKIPNKKNDSIPLIYIWHLWKHIGVDKSNSMIGQYIFPTEDIGNGLNAEWITLNLNCENCFDFEYTPTEGDNLYITQNVELSFYISFIFKNGEWTADHYSPFSDITELISTGKIIEP